MTAAAQRGVASVEAAAAILRVLRAHNQLVGLQALAAQTGMSASRVHHYMVSLVRTGLVRQDPQSKGYVLGAFALELGLAAADSLSIQHTSAAWLHRLSEQTGESSFFAVPSPRGPLIVRWEQGSRPLTVHARLGTVMPLLNSATGLVWLAFDRERSLPVLEAELRRIDPASRQALRRARQEEAEAVRRAGIARTRGTMISNVNALSCPVLTRSRQFAGILTVLGLGGYFAADARGRTARLLRTCSADFGRTLA